MNKTIINFKSRVAQVVSQCSHYFKNVFIETEYLILSTHTQNSLYYIIRADESNYCHLTGIKYHDSRIFFNKCINGQLSESDISYQKGNQNQSVIKGSIRRKITVLPHIKTIFTTPVLIEEGFNKNNINCSFAIGNKTFTIGFIVINNSIARPMSLLKGNMLNQNNSFIPDLIFSRKRGKEKFDTLIFGDIKLLKNYSNSVISMIDLDNITNE